jgi:phosphoribosylamine--glycine ligase
MGAYSPAPVVTPEVHARAMREIIMPTVNGMAPGRHALHRLPLRRPDDRAGRQRQDAGIQLPHGRPGNPADHDAPEERPGRPGRSRHHGKLDKVEAEWDRRVALGVVMAAAGYPDIPAQGRRHPRPAPAGGGDDYHVFHAGTALSGKDVVTSGGRVLCVTALGDNVRAAQMRAYEIAEQIEFAGMQMRRDIGHRAIRR